MKRRFVAALVLSGLCSACHTVPRIHQVYYLGVFDPVEQVPPQIYRVTVRGSSSAISTTQYPSGWVPAHLIDSLQGRVQLDLDQTSVEIESGERLSRISTGRRLVLFGPGASEKRPPSIGWSS
ncbi:MAG: hypothetical protein AAF628_33880 [Planctomycetota bacterium]